MPLACPEGLVRISFIFCNKQTHSCQTQQRNLKIQIDCSQYEGQATDTVDDCLCNYLWIGDLDWLSDHMKVGAGLLLPVQRVGRSAIVCLHRHRWVARACLPSLLDTTACHLLVKHGSLCSFV